MAGTTLAVALLAGCTGGGEGDGSDRPDGTSGSDPVRVETNAAVGQVAGKLGPKKRKRVLRQVTEVVDGWLDAAFVEGDYPRSDFTDAFPGFSDGAARQATGVGGMSNTNLGPKVSGVDVVKRWVRVDVLAPGGKPAGATARVVLVMDLSGEVERRHRIKGRLVLRPAGGGWEVFGFDVRRKQVKVQ